MLLLELYEDGVRRGQWSLDPALSLQTRKNVVRFQKDGTVKGVDHAGDVLADPIVGPTIEGEVEPRVLIDFSALALPAPQGKPLPRGQSASYERGGKTETQAHGWVGDWDDAAHRPAKAAKAPATQSSAKKSSAKKPAAKKPTAKKPTAKKPAGRR